METNYQKFLSGEYCNRLDKEVFDMIVRNKRLLAEFNSTDISDSEARTTLLHELFGRVGKHSKVDINFHCECGKHIFIGDKVIINMNCTFLDNNYITIGNNVLIAPNVQLYTATHPVSASEIYTAFHPTNAVERFGEPKANGSFEFCKTRTAPVIIGDNVWIGGGVIVLPGVTIGDNCVIGAGSVVTRSIPSNSLVVGNPCQVVKTI